MAIINGLLILMVVGYLFLWFLDFGRKLCQKPEETIDENGEKKKENIKLMAKIFGVALSFRIAVFLCGIVLYAMLSEGTGFSFADYLSYWNRWDGPHYLDLAQKGYANCVENGQHLFLVFFPLYPWCIRLLHLFFHNYLAAALVISFLAYSIGAVFFYLTVSEEYDEEVAQKSLVLLSVSPFAFYFGAVMTESLFFCLLSAEFYFIKKHRFGMAGVIGAFCALCRAQGVIVLGVGAVEFLKCYPVVYYFRERKGKDFLKKVFTKAIFLLLIPIGTILYLMINHQVEGNCFQFVIYQKEHWYLGPTFFTNTLGEIFAYLFHPETKFVNKICIWMPEFILFFLSFLALFYARKRHPLKYSAFLFVYVMINYSVTWLVSGARYMLCALPLFIIGGEFMHRHKRVYPFVIAVSAMLMMIYLMGFFQWKPVM